MPPPGPAVTNQELAATGQHGGSGLGYP